MLINAPVAAKVDGVNQILVFISDLQELLLVGTEGADVLRQKALAHQLILSLDTHDLSFERYHSILQKRFLFEMVIKE